MPRHCFLPSCVAVALVALLLPSLSARAADKPDSKPKDKEYEIRLDRPAKVGEKFRATLIGAKRQTATIKVEGEDERKIKDVVGVHLEGDIEVLAVSAKGKGTKIACTVRKCTITDGKETQELLPEGQVVTVEHKDDDDEYSLKGVGVVKEELADVLKLVLEVSDPDGPTDDELSGTRQKQKIGASWPIDAEIFAGIFAKEGMEVKKENVSGTAKLVDATKVDGVECLRIDIQVAVKNMRGAGKGLPEGMTVESGEMKAELTGMMPIDPALPSPTQGAKLTIKSVLKGKNLEGKPVTVQNEVELSQEASMEPIK